MPPAVLTSEPTVEVTPASFDVVGAHAVLAGTTVDVSDQLQTTCSGTLMVSLANGVSFPSYLDQSIGSYGRPVTVFDVVGDVRVQGLGLDRSFDLSGSYPTGAQLDPPLVVPTDPPTGSPPDGPTDPPTDPPVTSGP